MGIGLATDGGVVLDENGDWIFGYNRHLEKSSVFNIELWSILDGLQRRGHDRVIIQSDSLEAVRTTQDSASTTSIYALIRKIRRLLSHEG